MSNNSIFDSVSVAWSSGRARQKIVDLSCGAGDSAAMLAMLGYHVVPTDYGVSQALAGDRRVVGVGLNACLPFRLASFDAVGLVEVIEPIENQPQLSGEIARVLNPIGVVLISTPNIHVLYFLISITCCFIMDLKSLQFAKLG